MVRSVVSAEVDLLVSLHSAGEVMMLNVVDCDGEFVLSTCFRVEEWKALDKEGKFKWLRGVVGADELIDFVDKTLA